MTDAMFAAPGRFFRGNLHTHSTGSDGILDPQETCRRYRAEGYDFLAVTDHFLGLFDYPITDTTAYRTDDFTTLFGAELHSGAMQNGDLWHLLAVGLPLDFEPGNAPHFRPVEDQESGAEVAARARAAGAYVAIAHPHWSGLTMDDARSIEAAHAVEVYNHGCFAGCDRGEGFHTLDLLLNEGRRLDLCAGDDAHFSEPDHFGGWVMVKAAENTPDALLAALKAGHHYSSQGPDFRAIEWHQTHVIVECSAVTSVIVQGSASAATAVHGESMTRAKVLLTKFVNSPWVRISLIDRFGKRAWSNPVWRGSDGVFTG